MKSLDDFIDHINLNIYVNDKINLVNLLPRHSLLC